VRRSEEGGWRGARGGGDEGGRGKEKQNLQQGVRKNKYMYKFM
jgi:hypothetical protein